MPRGDYFEKLQEVIGTPEQNRELLVKAILLDRKMTCKSCNLTYQTGADMEQLDVQMLDTVTGLTKPTLALYLTCHCGHSGQLALNPNPFIIT